MKDLQYKTAERKIQGILRGQAGPNVVQKVVDLLYEEFEKYSWVGVYFIKGDILVLGPWRGEQATMHTAIPLGEGICGAAAKSGQTEIVADVSKDARYLSCFLSTCSEIVVPIRKAHEILGEIDIDSDRPAAFDTHDAVFLEKVADMLSTHI